MRNEHKPLSFHVIDFLFMRSALSVAFIVLGITMVAVHSWAAPATESSADLKSGSAMAVNTTTPVPGAAQGYPFRDAYSYGFDAHAVLTVANPSVRIGKTFSVEIRLCQNGGVSSYYNVYWNRLISVPGCLALYDSNKHFVCDLMAKHGGSWIRGAFVKDWTAIQGPGYVGAILSVPTPDPHYTYLPPAVYFSPGDYYLQVIYYGYSVQSPYESLDFDSSNTAEVFRSNVVPIKVLN